MLQISIFLENKAGQLADVTDFLARNQINLRALSIADTQDFGILRIIVAKPERVASLLRDAGYIFTTTDVLAVPMDDAPGALSKILHLLAGINVEYTYAFPTEKAGQACLVFRVDDNEKAMALLAAAGIHAGDASF